MRCIVILTVDGQQTITSTTDFMCAKDVACGLFAKAVDRLDDMGDTETLVFSQVVCYGCMFDVQPDRDGSLELVRVA